MPDDPNGPLLTPDPDAEQRARDQRYKPSFLQFFIGFTLMFLLHSFRHDHLAKGENLVSAIVTFAFAASFTWVLFGALMRWMNKLTWRAAGLYSACICAGMFAADVVYALLFMK